MQDIQTIFNDLQRIKIEEKSLRKDFRDALAQDAEYQRAKEAYDAARVTKRTQESGVRATLGSAADRLDELKKERTALEEMLSDIALTTLMRGESIAISDADHNDYEPVHKISFRKMQ